jgi:antagonist of KipI
MTLLGATLQFHEDTLIAICGGDLSPTCNEHPLPMWRPVFVEKGAIVAFGKARRGCRAYLAVAGGFDVKPVLGSKSTYLRGGIGGYQGRALQKGDVLSFGHPESFFTTTNWRVKGDLIPPYGNEVIVRVLKGSQFDAFTEASRHSFFANSYQVTPQSDRMGYRLQSQGETLCLTEPMEMISEAVAFGTIQVPPEGQPIVLMADRQTTGGYPKIADVITIDLPLIAQLKPGERVRFVPVEMEDAQELYLMREWEIGLLKQGILLKGRESV